MDCELFLLIVLAFVIPMLMPVLKRIFDVYIANFAEKRRFLWQKKYEIKEEITDLNAQYQEIKNHIERMAPGYYIISIIENDKVTIDNLDKKIDKIRFKDMDVANHFDQMSRALSIALDDMLSFHLCCDREKEACFAALLASKEEIKISSKNLKTIIETKYSKI